MPNWEFCAMGALGLSGGLLTTWNLLIVRCQAFETVVGILVKEKLCGSHSPLSILNCYGPYCNREIFWENAMIGGLLSIPNMIPASDLNLTLNAAEIWGKKYSLDPLGPHFHQLFYSYNMVDIAPSCAGPTWRNGRIGIKGLVKGLIDS